MTPRTILHADMDAFYASIEQREDPSLRGKPVIVGATAARGVVSAASYEARVFGVRSAMPGFRARELCPHGVFLPGRMELYAEVSSQVHEVFEEFTSEIEPIALDEAFLDITGSIRLFGGALALGQELKRRVRERTSLPVSVGIAPSKLVAKIACGASKPDGLRMITAEEVMRFLGPLPIRALWGIGPVMAERLGQARIRTLADLREYDTRGLEALIGDRAEELQRRARGEDDREVVTERAPKSIGEENTFSTDVLARQAVLDTVTAHAESVARRARKIGLRAFTVTLKIKLGTARGRRIARGRQEGLEPNYPILSRSKTLKEPTNDALVIRKVAMELWDKAGVTEPVRLLGVSVSSFEQISEQLELFAAKPDPKEEVGPTMDAIRERFGASAIFRGASAPEKLTPGNVKKRGD